MKFFRFSAVLATVLSLGVGNTAFADDAGAPTKTERGMDTQPTQPGNAKASERASSTQPPVDTKVPEQKDQERGHPQ